MHSKKVTATLLVTIVLLLSGCQSLQDVAENQFFKTPPGVKLLTESQIRGALVGNSYSGESVRSLGNNYLEFIDPDGTIRGQWNGRDLYKGEWAVHGKVWCYKRRGDSYCNTVARSGNTIYWYNLDGSGERARSRLYQGNPKNL